MSDETPQGDRPEGDDDATRIVAPTAPPPAPAPSPAPGAGAASLAPGSLVLHTYRIDRLIGKGGMGEVYHAVNVEIGTEHAIKVVRPELAQNEKVVELFKRGAGVLRRLRTDSVVAYDGAFRDETGRLYLAMEYVEGPSLADLIRQGPMTPEQVRILRDRIALGLYEAHQAGIVHRDVSPENIILPGGAIEKAKILDFDISKLIEASAATIVGEDFAGRYQYASPEQFGLYDGRIDGRSDVYSLGLVLAAAATGAPLDMGNSPMAAIEARREVPDLSAVPPGLREEIARMLAPDPDDRPATMKDLALSPSARIEPQRGRERAAPAPVQGAGAASPRKARGGLMAVAVLLLVVGGGAAFVTLTEPGRDLAADLQCAILPESEACRAPAVADRAAPDGSSAQAVPGDAASPGPPADPPGPDSQASETTSAASPADAPSESPPDGPSDQVAAVPAAVDPAAIRAALAPVTGRFDCASVNPSVAADGSVRLTGWVATPVDREALGRAAAGIEGVAFVDNATEVYPRPFCRVAGVLAAEAAGGPAPRITLGKPASVYFEGEPLTLQAAPPSGQAAYLSVVYIDNAGTVVHLLPTPGRPDDFAAAGEVLSIGASSSEAATAANPFYQISEPFGRSMIVAIASGQPLFESPRPQIEETGAWIDALRAALDRRPGAGASFVFLETVGNS